MTPTSPVAMTWKVVEHETPYTLQYRNGVPYVFGPSDGMGTAEPGVARRRWDLGNWWKLAGLGALGSLFAVTLLLPLAVASNTIESSVKNPMAVAGITATLGQRSIAQQSTTVVLVHDGEREIVAYKAARAYSTVAAVAASRNDSVVTNNSDGSLMYYAKSKPNNVYLAYPNLPYQIEIFDPAPGVALQLAKTVGLIDSLLA